MPPANFNFTINSKHARAFARFCEQEKYVKARAIEAAVMLIEMLPADLRQSVMRGDRKAIEAWLERGRPGGTTPAGRNGKPKRRR